MMKKAASKMEILKARQTSGFNEQEKTLYTLPLKAPQPLKPSIFVLIYIAEREATDSRLVIRVFGILGFFVAQLKNEKIYFYLDIMLHCHFMHYYLPSKSLIFLTG